MAAIRPEQHHIIKAPPTEPEYLRTPAGDKKIPAPIMVPKINDEAVYSPMVRRFLSNSLPEVFFESSSSDNSFAELAIIYSQKKN